jgi:hypothetical protein
MQLTARSLIRSERWLKLAEAFRPHLNRIVRLRSETATSFRLQPPHKRILKVCCEWPATLTPVMGHRFWADHPTLIRQRGPSTRRLRGFINVVAVTEDTAVKLV